MNRLFPLAMLPLLLPHSTAAAVVPYAEKDEIEGTITFTVQVRADDYQAVVNENMWSFRCSPKGGIGFGWHYGGSLSGTYWVHGITYKIDDQSPQTFNVLKKDDYRDLVKQLAAGARLVAKFEDDHRTTSFDLKGAREAFAPFFEQCIKP